MRSHVTLGPLAHAISIGPSVNISFTVPSSANSPLAFPTLDLGNVSAGRVNVPVQFRLAVGWQRVGFAGADAHPLVKGLSFGTLCPQWHEKAARFIRNDGTILRCQPMSDEDGNPLGVWLMLKGKDAEPVIERGPIPTPTVTPERSRADMTQAMYIVVGTATGAIVVILIFMVKRANVNESTEAPRENLGL
jgi:hypothetical protein